MNTSISIIPKPLSFKITNNDFDFPYNCISLKTNQNDSFLQKQLETAFNITGIITSDEGFPVYIEISKANNKLTNEAYTIDNSKSGMKITASDNSGAFYGCISAAQIIAACQQKCPEFYIEDKPAHSWRGFLLDTSRSFYSTAFIKKMLDACALHKINIFHWHLTDDQGWRFEVPDFENLTKIGATRAAPTMPPSEDGVFDEGKKIRRWYTDDEIKEIVEYAKERFIQIVPEVEFPGHSSALLAAYPEYGCTGGPYEVENRWGIFPDVLCLGNDKVFSLYKEILTKIAKLFPSQYIHIGGDECPHERWEVCPKCQQRIKKEGLKSAAELQAWGTKQIVSIVNSLGKIPIGWDEVLDNNGTNPLPQNVIVQSWQGIQGGIKAAELNHKVIMSPCSYYYLNFKNKDSFEEPGRLGVTTAQKTYSFSPTGKDLQLERSEYQSLILGGECTLWTEMLPHSRTAEYLLFPRFCAAAETFWLSEDKKDFENFTQRLITHKQLLHKLNYLYYDGELS